MITFPTELHGYSVEFSPFEENKLACATSQHFGIVGNGRQFVLDVGERGIGEVRHFDTQDGVYDCTWSEVNENHLLSATGDGSLKLWDTHAPRNPLMSFEEHTHEVYSADWNLVTKDLFLSGSWDCKVKVWNPKSHKSLRTYKEHTYCVYSTVWSPLLPDTFASASGDHTLKIWDVNEAKSKQTIRAHEFEILTCDWNKYNEFEVATGSVDKTIRIWDLRNPKREVMELHGHSYAVRRLKYSPHNENIIASCS